LAEIQFDRAVQADPLNAEAWAWLGESRSQLGGQGRLELDRALRINPHSAIVRGLRGLDWKREGRYPQALAEFLLAAGLEPGNPVWHSSLGEIYYLMGDLTSALTAYQRAVELVPQSAQYHRLLAVFCAETGTHVEDIGLPAALKAAELAPGDVQVLDALGWNYLASGRYALAEQTLLQAVAGDDRSSTTFSPRLHLAMTYLAQGNKVAAYEQLLMVRDGQPGSSLSELAANLLKQYYP
jgi:tetratricopeptide (TPR) repeat protein